MNINDVTSLKTDPYSIHSIFLSDSLRDRKERNKQKRMKYMEDTKELSDYAEQVKKEFRMERRKSNGVYNNF